MIKNQLQYYEASDIDNILQNPLYYFIPVFGSIPCGIKNYLDGDIRGYVEIPKSYLGSGDYFILRAEGDSMIHAGISDGDLVVIKKQHFATESQIAVAYIDGEVTLKRFHNNKQKGVVEFLPDNENYEPIEASEYLILGIAVKIIKDL